MLSTVLFVASVCSAAEEGLVAHYPCDEGQGTTLRDASDHGNEGAISGAQYVRFGEGWALQLDGVDDFVDLGNPPGLDLRQAVTVEAWVSPQSLPAGEAGIVGKDYASYVLTHYRDGQCWWYISGGGNNCKAPVSLEAWHHVVGTFDGERLKLYVDGALADIKTSDANEAAAGGTFWIGKSTGDPQFTRGAHFHGQVDEIRVYDRALSAAEVLQHYRTTHLTQTLALTCRPYPFMGQVTVQVDPRGLGELPAGTQVRLTVTRPGVKQPLATQTVGPLQSWQTAAFALKLAGTPGEHELTAQALSTKPIGRPATLAFTWPATQAVAGGDRAVKPLNNLVAELLNAPKPGSARQWQFTNPRDGWVYFAASGIDKAQVVLDQPAGPDPLAALPGGKETTVEAMRRLPAGKHTLRSDAGLSRLVIRAIPELLFAKFGADPHVQEFGPYDWEFLKRYVLPSLTTMVGNGSDAQRSFAEEWKAQGRRWIVECGVPGLSGNAPVDPAEAEAAWTGNPGMKDPLLDGLIVDEFWGGDLPQYPGWTEAVRRMNANPALRGKSFYPYCGGMYGSEASQAFMRAVFDGGHCFAHERYLPEQRTENAARTYLDSLLTAEATRWEKALPGSVSRMVVCFGYFSAPPESLDVDPGVNHKVYLDMQFHLVANDPAFANVAGLMTYLCSYSDEETVRWAGKLFRHYAIEGHSERMANDPYVLPHLANGDFEEGTVGWEVSLAEEGGISTGSMSGLSWLEGRYPKTSQGDTYLLMKRSQKAPNRVSQALRALTPGRLYSLRFLSADIGDLSQQQKLALSVTLSGAEVLPDKQFQHVFANCYSHHLGPYDDKNHAWMNYHWLVFKATGPEARLTIADWLDDRTPGGPVGQQLAVNFVQVQPYDAP